MSAGLGMAPSAHLGVVVLSNMDQSWLPMALVWRVVDAYTGRPQKDWSGAILKAVTPLYSDARGAELALQKTYQPGPASLPLAAYTGTYRDDLYGEVVVKLVDGKLTLHASKRFIGELRHWNHDTFQVQWGYAYLGKGYVTFDLDTAGKPTRLTLPGVASYTRVSAATGAVGE
jgi:hypothetical protein